jgi:hypothetical protein
LSSQQEGPDQDRGIKQAEGWVRALLRRIVDVNIDLMRYAPDSEEYTNGTLRVKEASRGACIAELLELNASLAVWELRNGYTPLPGTSA